MELTNKEKDILLCALDINDEHLSCGNCSIMNECDEGKFNELATELFKKIINIK